MELYPSENEPNLANMNGFAAHHGIDNQTTFVSKNLGDGICRLNFGCSLNNCRRFDEAEKIFRLGLVKRSLSPFDRTALYLNLADTYFQRDQYEKALSLLDSAKMGLTNRGLYHTIIQAENQIKREAHYPQSTQ